MKIVTERTPKDTDRKEFPRLMESIPYGFIVLFTDYEEGVVVQSNEEGWYAVGDSHMWIMEDFRDFYGTITISSVA